MIFVWVPIVARILVVGEISTFAWCSKNSNETSIRRFSIAYDQVEFLDGVRRVPSGKLMRRLLRDTKVGGERG
jgi:predicted nucleic acid-binding protein